mmetsp:Transcript_136930/g.237981  ORF Transcript_136930/g.237981 Transcript_136930/m.237981 type:complete len:217 (+) Transcript_136930:710-1360(+)
MAASAQSRCCLVPRLPKLPLRAGGGLRAAQALGRWGAGDAGCNAHHITQHRLTMWFAHPQAPTDQLQAPGTSRRERSHLACRVQNCYTLQPLNHRVPLWVCLADYFLTVLRPPSRPIICPVIHVAPSPKRNAVSSAASSGCPSRPRGCAAAMAAAIFSFETILPAKGVCMSDGAMQLTLTFGDHSAARAKVSPSTPPFAAEIREWLAKPERAATVL